MEAHSSLSGIAGILFIVFLILKLTHHITWSWIWVFAPLWIPLTIWLLVVLVTLFLYYIKTK